MYIVYIRESYCLFLFPTLCTFEKGINFLGGKVVVENVALRFRGKMDNRLSMSSNSHFHPLFSYGSSPQ